MVAPTFLPKEGQYWTNPSPKLKYHHLDPQMVTTFGRALSFYIHLLQSCNKSRPLVVVGIGTDRSTGDSLGPLVGSELHRLGAHFKKVFVYGTLDDPVHAENLEEKLEFINRTHSNCLVMAIDAGLGQVDSVGSVTFALGPVRPGAGVNKKLTPVGDIHFTGIVNVGGYMEYLVLQNTRLSLVVRMAEAIARSIMLGLHLLVTPEFEEKAVAELVQ